MHTLALAHYLKVEEKLVVVNAVFNINIYLYVSYLQSIYLVRRHGYNLIALPDYDIKIRGTFNYA